jgi:hypothetical protein
MLLTKNKLEMYLFSSHWDKGRLGLRAVALRRASGRGYVHGTCLFHNSPSPPLISRGGIYLSDELALKL